MMRTWILVAALAAVAAASTTKQCHNLGFAGGCEGPPYQIPTQFEGSFGNECADGTMTTGVASIQACQSLCQAATSQRCALYVYQEVASTDGSVPAGSCLMWDAVAPCCPSMLAQTRATALAGGGPSSPDDATILLNLKTPFNFTEGVGSIGICADFPTASASTNYSCPDIYDFGSFGSGAQTQTQGGVITIQHTPPTGCDIISVSTNINSASDCQAYCQNTKETCGGWVYQLYQKYDATNTLLSSPPNTPVCYILPATFPNNNCPGGAGQAPLQGLSALGGQNDLGHGGFCFAVCGDGLLGFNEQCEGSNLNGTTSCSQLNSTLYVANAGSLSCGLNCDYDTTQCQINSVVTGTTLQILCTDSTCTIQVVLPVQPIATVSVTLTLQGAVGTISIPGTSGNTLIFTTTNWFVPQLVLVQLSSAQAAKAAIDIVASLVLSYISLDPTYNGRQTVYTLVTTPAVAGQVGETVYGYAEPNAYQGIQRVALTDPQGAYLQTDTTNSFNGSGAAGIVYAALGSTFGLLVVVGIITALVCGRRKNTP